MTEDAARNLLATLAFVGMVIGFWMAWPPLGLIVPCGLLFGCLVWTHLRVESERAEPAVRPEKEDAVP